MSHVDYLRKLSVPGVVGFATHCEVTEIFANIRGLAEPHNVFTISVLEERTAAAPACLLNPARLKVPKLDDWTFGIQRTVLDLNVFVQNVEKFAVSGVWDISGERLATAKLRPINPKFVPSDWATEIPLNHVLKNNFWSGSHVLEWADSEKLRFKVFFEMPAILSDLAAAVMEYLPVDLSAVSDRMGNIIIQIPVTVVTSSFGLSQDRNSYDAQLGWHPKAAPRPLNATITTEFDETLTGFASKQAANTVTNIPYPDNAGLAKATLWDEQNGLLLSSTAPMRFFGQINFTMHAVGITEPRTFTFTGRDNVKHSQQIALRPPSVTSSVGVPRQDPNGEFTQDRLYKHATETARKQRLFVLYGTNIKDPEREHEIALQHLRELTGTHGQTGAWLWDPYLEAIDVVQTLFHSPHSGSDLRALCSGDNVEGRNTQTFISDQKQYFTSMTGNFEGLRLEYRAAHTISNINFHDRFLIFPREGQGALAWSLGTSVNNIGKVHHILQQVDDGQRVGDAFTAFWGRLDSSHLIWKHP